MASLANKAETFVCGQTKQTRQTHLFVGRQSRQGRHICLWADKADKADTFVCGQTKQTRQTHLFVGRQGRQGRHICLWADKADKADTFVCGQTSLTIAHCKRLDRLEMSTFFAV